MCKKACDAQHKCCKRCFDNIGNFFKQEHTPLENGLLVSTAILGGIVIGFLCAPDRTFQLGSSNGCANTITSNTSKPTKDK